METEDGKDTKQLGNDGHDYQQGRIMFKRSSTILGHLHGGWLFTMSMILEVGWLSGRDTKTY